MIFNDKVRPAKATTSPIAHRAIPVAQAGFVVAMIVFGVGETFEVLPRIAPWPDRDQRRPLLPNRYRRLTPLWHKLATLVWVSMTIGPRGGRRARVVVAVAVLLMSGAMPRASAD